MDITSSTSGRYYNSIVVCNSDSGINTTYTGYYILLMCWQHYYTRQSVRAMYRFVVSQRHRHGADTIFGCPRMPAYLSRFRIPVGLTSGMAPWREPLALVPLLRLKVYKIFIWWIYVRRCCVCHCISYVRVVRYGEQANWTMKKWKSRGVAGSSG